MTKVEQIQALLDSGRYSRKDGQFSYYDIKDPKNGIDLEEAIYRIIQNAHEWSITTDELGGVTYISYAFVEIVTTYSYNDYSYKSIPAEEVKLYHGVIHCIEDTRYKEN